MSRSIGLLACMLIRTIEPACCSAPADWSGRWGARSRTVLGLFTDIRVGCPVGQGVAFRRVPFALRGCVVNTAAYPLGVRLTTLVQRRNRRVTLAPRV